MVLLERRFTNARAVRRYLLHRCTAGRLPPSRPRAGPECRGRCKQVGCKTPLAPSIGLLAFWDPLHGLSSANLWEPGDKTTAGVSQSRVSQNRADHPLS